jgi:hypothetical protein
MIMPPPFTQQTSQVVFTQRHHEVQAFPPQRAQEPLTEGIGLGALGWGLQHPKTQVAHTLVEVPGEDRIPVDEDQRLVPIEPAGEPGQGHPSRLRSTAWLDLAFLEQGRLFTQKEVLRRKGKTGAQAQAQEAPRIHGEQQRMCEGARLRSRPRYRVIQGLPLIHKLWFLLIIALYWKTRRPAWEDRIFAEDSQVGITSSSR